MIAELMVRCLHRCFGSGNECVVTVYDRLVESTTVTSVLVTSSGTVCRVSVPRW